MTTSRSIQRGLLSFILVLVLSASTPLAVFAEGTTDTDATTTSTATQATENPTPTQTEQQTNTPTPPSSNQTTPTQGATNTGASDTGPSQPNGASANTYTFNESTGLWENEHYTWNPKTKVTTPKTAPTYSYNPTTDRWDTTEWQYNAATGKYEPNVYATYGPATGAYADRPSESDMTTGAYNGFYNASISNNLTTTAMSGNAFLGGNTYAGSAMTGNALAMANVINLLQSSTGLGGGALSTFNLTVPVQQTWTGDINLNPSNLSALAVAGDTTALANLQVNSQNSGLINNDLVVAATSGSAAVIGNSNAGSAVSGDANAVANVMNVINSAITSGQSFIGAINILGNLDGDILLPDGMLETLLASNAPGTTNAVPTNISDTSALANLVNNQSVTNTINSNAATGSATTANNTNAGNTQTGDALNNITVLNMTGREIVGASDLLVFVNVLGKWVGMIVNAPGATAASLGGGITQNNQNSAVNTENNSAINNNIDISATSGDAIVAENTNAGDARTGNATTSVNLGNFINSHLSLSDWFGILFINVFGSWNGSFGINTAAGNPASIPGSGSGSGQTGNGTGTNVQVYAFVPTDTANGQQRYAVARTGGAGSAGTPTPQTDVAILGATDTNAINDSAISVGPALNQPTHIPTWVFPAVGMFIAIALLLTERLITNREKRAVAGKLVTFP